MDNETQTPSGTAFTKPVLEQCSEDALDASGREVLMTGWPGLGQPIDRRPHVAPEENRGVL